MGVYIKGMETPKDGEHPLWISLHSDGTVEYNANKGDGWQMTTAVPVPPHGRLIDADALIARYEAQRTEDRDILCDERAFPSDYEKAQYRYSRNSDFISALKSQAAIIPAEEGET